MSTDPKGTAVLAGRAPGGHHVAYPRGKRNVQVPSGSRRAALAGLGLHAPCRALPMAAHHAVTAAVALAGPRALAGRRRTWSPGTGADAWQALVADWSSSIGAFDSYAVYARTRPVRPGVALVLIRGGRRLAFVRVRAAGDGAIDRERRVLEALAAAAPGSFRVPAVLAAGSVPRWSWLATGIALGVSHRPVRRPPLARIGEEIAAALGDLGLAWGGTPAPGWTPMHGDLAPWNLRRHRGTSWLVDWEDVDWGPPGADATYWALARTIVTGARPAPAPPEAVDFWDARIRARLTVDPESRFLATALDVLARMGAGR